MNFFDEPSVTEVSQAHIEAAVKLEDAEALRLIKRFRDTRRELRDRLDTIPSGTFTAQQVRGTLYQIELAIQEMTKTLAGEMKSSAGTVATAGVEDLASEIERWDSVFGDAISPINIDAVRIADDTSNFLFNQYDTSLKAYGESLRSQFANALTQSALEQITVGEVVSRLSKTFLGEEWKLHRIARTELHNVYNIGKMNGMTELRDGDLPDLKKTLFHPMDSRTAKDSKALNRKNPIIPIDEPFRFNWDGKERVFMAPPDRPNDRAILIPYRASWGK